MKKINLKKQSEVYKERGNASYALYGFSWAFLVWIYEAFPHLGKYAKKSLDSPLSIPRLLRWHTTKRDNVVEGDPFKYKGRSTNVVHPYLILTVREIKQNYMATLKPYTDEVKDTIIDALKANLKGVIVLTSSIENVEDGYSSDHNPNQPCENFVPNTSKDESLCERNEEEEKLEEEGLATDVAEVEKEIDVMGTVMELNGEVGGDE
ncbi:hypothetical protein H5410_042592 [Solanum commersonii]|uniref:Uncharacterized protein n=1 Tax=Solanum commersonii TaxID=4109 RepID=A0A9J5XZ11_SOLCO|nr:hypothetical protein H5410_042592 [Solanum commersonii]